MKKFKKPFFNNSGSSYYWSTTVSALALDSVKLSSERMTEIENAMKLMHKSSSLLLNVLSIVNFKQRMITGKQAIFP